MLHKSYSLIYKPAKPYDEHQDADLYPLYIACLEYAQLFCNVDKVTLGKVKLVEHVSLSDCHCGADCKHDICGNNEVQ